MRKTFCDICRKEFIYKIGSTSIAQIDTQQMCDIDDMCLECIKLVDKAKLKFHSEYERKFKKFIRDMIDNRGEVTW